MALPLSKNLYSVTRQPLYESDLESDLKRDLSSKHNTQSDKLTRLSSIQHVYMPKTISQN